MTTFKRTNLHKEVYSAQTTRLLDPKVCLVLITVKKPASLPPLFVVCFEAGSLHVVQVILNLKAILLPQAFRC